MGERAKFLDILELRKTESGIFRFMSKAWYPKRTQVLDKIYTPQDIKDAAASSLYLETIIEAESSRSGVSKEKLRQEVLRYINEIGMDKKLHVIRWMGIFSLKLAFMMNIGIYVNEAAVLRLKSSMGKNPVLFLPTHRSYADFCILTYLCYHYDIEFPAVATGMDFYSMAVIGQLLRETCAFYIRRTLAGAPLYAGTLRQYVRTLVARHCAPIEFFLEGTRSRSNKSLPPKYGMLSMSLMPLFAREVPDVTIVPVNISYDRLMEQNTFAYELLGVPKPKETTKGLLKWVSTLNGHFGNMYISVGEAISARALLREASSGEALKPIELQALSPEQFRQVQEIADYTVTQQQDNSVATISNLVALVLAEGVVRGEAPSYSDVVAGAARAAALLRARGARVFEGDVSRSLDRVLRVQAASWMLDKDRRLRIISTPPIEVTEDLKKKMKGHILDAETMANAIPFIQLQMYVNPMLHFLVPAALVCCIVNRAPVTREALAKDYHQLRKLLRHEFFHVEKGEEKTFVEAVEFCERHGAVRVSGETLARGEDEDLQRLLRYAVWPALGSLLLCADVMTEQVSCSHGTALRLAQRLAQRRARGAALPPACLSLDSAAHCLRGALLAGALRRTDSSPQSTEYQLVPEEMSRCRALVASVLPQFDVDFSPRNPVIIDHKARARL